MKETVKLDSRYRLQCNEKKGRWRIQEKEYEDRPCGGFSWKTLEVFTSERDAHAELEKLREKENPDAGWETIS